MKTRNIALTLEKAKEWYNSSNEALKEAALQAFTKEELTDFDFRSITTFEDAVEILYPEENYFIYDILSSLNHVSQTAVASFKLNIIRKALNKSYDISFTNGDIYYPSQTFVYARYHKGTDVLKVKIKGIIYILRTNATYSGSENGLGCMDSNCGIFFAREDIAFLGCATAEIAEHFGKYFVKEIFEAKYGDLIDYTWID